MKSTFFALAAITAAGSASAQVAGYGQCGGNNWSGETSCKSGFSCQKQNDWYSQCVPGTAAATKAAATTKAASTKASTTAKPTSAAQTSTKKPASVKPASTTQKSSAAKASPTTVSHASSGGVQFAGVNIAGLDFGCGTDGTCNTGGIVDPGQTGLNQMKHFVDDDGLNTFRIPVGWQYLVDSVGGTLNADHWATYDKQIQGCLDAGAAMCIVDIHNYARWNGAIVGQGGPTDVQFASLWSQIATKYKGNTKIAFGLMNEPHDVTIDTWATTVQAAVTAIRKAGATGNKILLPGNEWTHASAFISNGSGDALSKVTNLDGSTTNLIFDVHQYLDSDGSGTHTACTTNNVETFETLGAWLQKNKRQAILTETGGSSEASCLQALCEQFDAMNKYSDVYLGWTGWSAGMFDSSYELTETPTQSGSKWTDKDIVTKCVAGKFGQ